MKGRDSYKIGVPSPGKPENLFHEKKLSFHPLRYSDDAEIRTVCWEDRKSLPSDAAKFPKVLT